MLRISFLLFILTGSLSKLTCKLIPSIPTSSQAKTMSLNNHIKEYTQVTLEQCTIKARNSMEIITTSGFKSNPSILETQYFKSTLSQLNSLRPICKQFNHKWALQNKPSARQAVQQPETKITLKFNKFLFSNSMATLMNDAANTQSSQVPAEHQSKRQTPSSFPELSTIVYL